MNRSLTLTVIVTMEIITPNFDFFFNHMLKKKTICKVGKSDVHISPVPSHGTKPTDKYNVHLYRNYQIVFISFLVVFIIILHHPLDINL